MSITYAGFAATLAGLDVAGVRTSYDYTPNIDTSGNYPMMFPRVPSGEVEVGSLTSLAGLRRVTCDLVVIVQRDTMDTAESRFNDTVAMIDAISAALETEMEESDQIDSWVIVTEINESEWSIVATVEASG